LKFTSKDITLLLITLFGSLSLVDVITTTYLTQRGMQELNPFISPFISDPATFLAVKIIGIFIIIGLAHVTGFISYKGEQVTLATVCGISAYPVLWNILLLLTKGF